MDALYNRYIIGGENNGLWSGLKTYCYIVGVASSLLALGKNIPFPVGRKKTHINSLKKLSTLISNRCDRKDDTADRFRDK